MEAIFRFPNTVMTGREVEREAVAYGVTVDYCQDQPDPVNHVNCYGY
jgi:hypothetical protein